MSFSPGRWKKLSICCLVFGAAVAQLLDVELMVTSNIFRRILVFGLLTVGVLTFASAMITYEFLRSHGPRQSNVETGHIYPMKMQQPFDVFLTKFQTEWIQCGPAIGGGIAIVAAFLNMRWKIIHNLHDDIPKKFY
jgi:hypothetical protein